MKCSLNQDYLQMYIDNQLDNLEIIVLEEHLKTCKSCLRELNKLKVLDWDLRRMPEPEVPEELEALREKLVAQYVVPQQSEDAEENKYSNTDYLKLQYSNIKHTIKFVNYLPGSKVVKGLTSAGYNKAAEKSKKQVYNLLKKIMGI